MENKIIVAFHIGRGGRFNNSNHKTFIGEKNFQDLINMNMAHLYYTDDDKSLIDANGNSVTDDDVDGEVGILNFDHDYDTDIARYIEDCTDAELQLIAGSKEYKTPELEEYLKENYNQ